MNTETTKIQILANEIKKLNKMAENLQKTTHHQKAIKPICPYCKAPMIQFEYGINAPLCENPICPSNNYIPKE